MVQGPVRGLGHIGGGLEEEGNGLGLAESTDGLGGGASDRLGAGVEQGNDRVKRVDIPMNADDMKRGLPDGRIGVFQGEAGNLAGPVPVNPAARPDGAEPGLGRCWTRDHFAEGRDGIAPHPADRFECPVTDGGPIVAEQGG